MLRSLYSGVSGMRSFQTKMDVIANNIANVNTTGFKAGRVKFQDMLSQTTANAQMPTRSDDDDRYGLGGVNPQQIGLGVMVGSIDTIMTGGSPMPTSRNLDFAIAGEGFFVLSQASGTEPVYTRDGAFYTDYDGNLINSSGLKVMGYANQNFDDEDAELELEDPLVLSPFQIPQRMDESGTPILPDDYGDDDWKLQEFTIDGTGAVIGIYGDGENARAFIFGQVAVAKFNNPEGLEKLGNNNYINSNNSGNPELGQAGSAGYGVIRQGFLEMSNVDLANEFTEMIVTSRAYQANSRSITTSDEMLQELINLKR